MEAKTFVNYYEFLEVSPSATSEAIEHNFRHLARRYHPDNRETGDRSKFDAVIKAHDTLRDAARRARYHQDHQDYLPPLSQSPKDAIGNTDSFDIDIGASEDPSRYSIGIDRDVSIQNNILTMLYFKRRRNVREPGIGSAELEHLSGCPYEHLEFHLWYLKAKGWIATGEDGLLAITIDGVDRASMIHQEFAKKLLTDQS
ncbi:MAG TPA: J domain-containing protein [Phenylobacterium sp.]|uniref:J domain-containing protein n=1 Tax=Phenylobacterium sp. TaxID=1871053 RepID=UPI002B4A2748|nr:J domain-containing protein [Phenylobacterium sp.]HKR87227.1 J domain-containing protein [Phenylobacterium sp.]